MPNKTTYENVASTNDVCQELWKQPIKQQALDKLTPLPTGPSFTPQSGTIGLEMEIFAFCKDTLEPFGLEHHDFGVQQLLRKIHDVSPDSLLKIDEATGVATGVLLANKGNFSIEPGGQIEFSSKPCGSLYEVAQETVSGLQILERAAENRLVFLGTGTNPLTQPNHPLALPKERYKIMTRYFNAIPGGRGVHMMRHTATVQPNIDIPGTQSDWEDAVNLVWILTPFARHLFANSPWFQNARSQFFSERSAIWQKVDVSRSGIPPQVPFAKDPVCAYARWAREAWVFYVPGLPLEQQPLPGKLSFQQWLEKGYEGCFPTLGDWETHLGTLFPDLRLRNFLEVRSVDAQPFEHMLAPAAFFVHALQNPERRRQLWAYLRELCSQRCSTEHLSHLFQIDFADKLFSDLAVHQKLLALVQEQALQSKDFTAVGVLQAYSEFLPRRASVSYAKQSARDFVENYKENSPSAAFSRYVKFSH